MHSRSLLFAGLLAAVRGGLVAGYPQRRGASEQHIVVEASRVTGRLKNLQGTNNAETEFTPSDTNDIIHDLSPALGQLFPEYGIKHVLIYSWADDFFTGFGENGTAGDALLNENYNWTLTDEYIRFVTSHGAKASVQFNTPQGTNASVSTPEILGDVGFMITDRYMHGAHGSGFHNAIDLFDFYAESDLLNLATIEEAYENSFAFFAGFARGVARANSSAGVGAWGNNRVWPVHTNYSIPDPYVTRFFNDCKVNNIPLKAATYHFTNAQYSMDPYDIKRVTDKFRSETLVPAGFATLPVWVTEFELNPGAINPTTQSALSAYHDPSLFASFTLGTSMYAQDAENLQQTMPWPGFGYGGIGAGNQSFPAWFNKTADNATVPLNVAAAWKLQAELVVNTPDRLELEGASPNGFAALAGGNGGEEVQILLNNYQLDYDIPREIANGTVGRHSSASFAYTLTVRSFAGPFNQRLNSCVPASAAQRT
ncbi:hypothetical protein LTR36_009316 [Oleoguttula mirabilis]|uniref:Uncharacterized protein n=1 Tax=Oleoguttula mirabilis TaxID=1507867 RepID=A0AAV9J5X1_9PEZI|nr:hypothetical protein LTR36_009316 [Oleoguttula mirabilis]